ncbi:BA75_03138T0 [Komagataella pastoris]|uniref:BA75_03138T0 n=1 Tax=Komagataella pastoris TaxID=4922 RepID=A0A1B2JCD0_PICPA|nr:BA75_03138T0 [Komagataella pastoris]
MTDRNSLRVPPIRGPPSSSSRKPLLESSLSAPGAGPRRQKIGLKPGHSAMDWAQLKQNKGDALKGNIDPSQFPLRVTKEELKRHNSKDDCWMALNRKVYNISPYIEFHPGGVDILMKCAGKDGTLLFQKYHHWVNADRILDSCWVGIMV